MNNEHTQNKKKTFYVNEKLIQVLQEDGQIFETSG